MAIDVEPSLPKLEPIRSHRDSGRQGHTDGYRLARALIIILLATALDVTNFLDKGNSIRYALLLVPIGALFAIRLAKRASRLRRPQRSDYLLLALFALGFSGVIWGAVHFNTKSGMRPVFFPMAIAFLYLGTLEDPTDREIVALLRALSLVGVAYAVASVAVHLSNVIPLGILVKLAAYRQYKNATLLYLAMGIAATYALRQHYRFVFLLAAALFIFKAYPSGTAVLVLLGTAFTFYLTGSRRSNLRPYLIGLAAALAVAVVLLNFSAGVGIASDYFSAVGKRNNNGTRIALWTAGVQEFQKSPVLGKVFTGETVIDTHRAGQQKVFQLPFHNDYILFMVEGGVIGLGLLLLWVILAELTVLRRQGTFLGQGDHGRAALLRTLLIGFNAFFITAAFNPLVTAMSSSATIFAIYGLMMLVGAPKPAPAVAEGRRAGRFGARSVSSRRRRAPASPTDMRRRWHRHTGVLRRLAAGRRVETHAKEASKVPTPLDEVEDTVAGFAVEETVPLVAEGGEGGPQEPGGLTLEAVKRKLLRGSAWVLGGRIVTVVLGLILNKVLANLLTQPEMAAYFQSLVLVFIGSVIAQLGLDRAVVRFVSTAMANGEPGRARWVVRRVFSYVAVSSVITALVLYAAGTFYAHHLAQSGGAILATLMPLAAGWLIMTALRALLVDTFRGFQKFNLSTIFDQFLMDVLTVTIFGAMYVLHLQTDVHQIVLISTVLSAVALLVGLGLLLGRTKRLGHDGGALPKGELYAMAWPLLITNIAIYLLGTGIDQFTLGIFRPEAQVALYGAAGRVMFLVATPYLILQGVTPPLIAEMYAKGKKGEMERTLRMVSTVAGLPAAVALMIFMLWGGQVMSLFFKPEYAAAAGVLAILSTGRLIAVWTGSAGVTLMMTGNQKPLMYITVFSGVASVLAGLLLAPRFGMVGVAVGTASTQAMQNTLQLLLVKRRLGIWTCAHLSPKPLMEFLRKSPTSGKPAA